MTHTTTVEDKKDTTVRRKKDKMGGNDKALWSTLRTQHNDRGLTFKEGDMPHWEAVRMSDEERRVVLEKATHTQTTSSCVDLIRMAGWAGDINRTRRESRRIQFCQSLTEASPVDSSVPGYQAERDATMASAAYKAMKDLDMPEEKMQRGTKKNPISIEPKTERFARASGASEARLKPPFSPYLQLFSLDDVSKDRKPIFKQRAPDHWSWQGRHIYLSSSSTSTRGGGGPIIISPRRRH